MLPIFRYVPRDDTAGRLPAAIQDAIRLIELEEGKTYTIQTNSRLEKIPYEEILYIEGRENSCITTTNGTTQMRKSLQQIHEELASEGKHIARHLAQK